LWNEDTERIKAGDRIHVISGWVSEWQGEKQLTTGRMGKIEIVKEGAREIKIEKGQPEEVEGEVLGEDKEEEPLADEEDIKDE